MSQKYVQRDPASSKWSEMLLDRAMRQGSGRMPPGAPRGAQPPAPPIEPAMNPEMFDPMAMPRAAAPMGAAAAAGGASPWLAPALAALLYPRSTADASLDELPIEQLLAGQRTQASADPDMAHAISAQEAMDEAPASMAPQKVYRRKAPQQAAPSPEDARAAVHEAAQQSAPPERELDFLRASDNAMRALKRQGSKEKSGVQTPIGTDMKPMTMEELIRRREESRNATKNQMR